MEPVYKNILQDIQETVSVYMSPDKLTEYAGNIFKIALILVAMCIAIRVMNAMVDRFFSQKSKIRAIGEEKKMNTLQGIVKSVLKYTIYFVAFVPILETLGIRVTSLLAAAGIGGLAIGFGAQNLVRDMITGFFILLEDQFQVGDYVEVAGHSGIVEDITLRVTKIKDFNGDLHIIPNGMIEKVTNKSRNNMKASVEVGISYEEDIDKAISILEKICAEMARENDKIMEGPTVLGITNFEDSKINISITAKTLPMEQWGVERELRKRIREQFDRAGIAVPYPKCVMIQKTSQDLEGKQKN